MSLKSDSKPPCPHCNASSYGLRNGRRFCRKCRIVFGEATTNNPPCVLCGGVTTYAGKYNSGEPHYRCTNRECGAGGTMKTGVKRRRMPRKDDDVLFEGMRKPQLGTTMVKKTGCSPRCSKWFYCKNGGGELGEMACEAMNQELVGIEAQLVFS